MPPLVLNFTKTGIAIILIVLTLLIQQEVPVLEPRPLLLLLVSGVVGIGIGDTAFFSSLNCLGARRSLLLEALAPPLAALLAALFLQEQLSVRACLGIALTIAGVAWVVIERTPDTIHTDQPQPDNIHTDQLYHKIRLARGIGFGLLAALAQASGAVLSRAALVSSAVDPLWSTLTRLVGGIVVVIGLLAVHRSMWKGFIPLRSRQFLAVLTGTSFAGTYLAIWLQQIALKYTQAGIAQSLSATSPLFVIPLAIWTGERVSMRACLGVLVALGGVWLLFE